MSVTIESAFLALWNEAKDSADYDEGHWVTVQKSLDLLQTELSRCLAELARYRTVTRLIEEIILEQDERVPRGKV